MAVKLWSTRTPGTAQLERDLMVMNNKKKVGLSHTHTYYSQCKLSTRGHQDVDGGGGSFHPGLAPSPGVR